MGHDHASHASGQVSADADRRWLAGALAVLVVFMAGEVVAGLLAHSLALLTDAGHLLTDAAALLVAIVAVRLSERPARGAYTYGFARIDALAGQANGITLLLLSIWFAVGAVRRLVDPSHPEGGVILGVALAGVLANLVAAALAGRVADRAKLSVRGAVAHLVNDLYAFIATAVAGALILLTGWRQADSVAALVIAVLMAYTGIGLLRAAGRIFLEAAPIGLDPQRLGVELAAVAGVAQVHDLHIWQLGAADSAVSAHVLVEPSHDCHAVGATLRYGSQSGTGSSTSRCRSTRRSQHGADD